MMVSNFVEDGNGLNNIDANLRDGSGGVNSRNRRLGKQNTSGHVGINDMIDYLNVRWSENGKRKGAGGHFYFRDYSSNEETWAAAINYRDEQYKRVGNENGKRPKIVDA